MLQAFQASQGHTGFLGRSLIEGRRGGLPLQGRLLFFQRLDLSGQRLQLALLFVTELAARRRDRCRNWRRRHFFRLRRLALFLNAKQTWRPALAQPVLVAADVLAHPAVALEHQSAGHHVVEERPVVADHQHRALEVEQHFAERLRIPVAYSASGQGAIDSRHELNLGLVARNGHFQANQATRQADVLLALGVRFDDRTSSSWIPGYSFTIPPTRLIHVDIDPDEIGRNYPVALGLMADERTFLRQVNAVLDRLAEANILIAAAGEPNLRTYMPTIDLPVIANSAVVDDIVQSSAVHDPPVVLFVGEMLERKGIVTLLDALDRVDEKGVPYELRIVSDNRPGLDPDKDAMIAEITRRGRADAMTGPLPRAEVYRHLSESDVYVFPTWTEGQPFTVIEALSSGVPIVASDIQAISAMITDPENGRLLPMTDSAAFADAIIELLADPERRRTISDANRALARRRFDRAVFRRDVAELYRRHGRPTR